MAEHECIQAENIGALKEAAQGLKDAVERLDTRINGTFRTIGEHVSDSPQWHTRIELLEKACNDIKEEKCNTAKASQWRIGLIVAMIPTIVAIVLHFLK